ncbi:MAG: DNA/RNA nuclease SfsA [Rickettsiales bacterium]|nr:DNA/RNA nuclease SfsA [Rickettsiales bacterium]
MTLYSHQYLNIQYIVIQKTKKFLFQEPLMEGVILERKNRFIMKVMVNNKIETCHCPTTGRVGNIVFKNVPCLLAINSNTKTKYTVEAVSLSSPEICEKKWIGINQVKANRYVKFFLETNQMPRMVKINKNSIISRERLIGKSRLDFLIDEDVRLEVKTPLVMLPLRDNYVTNENVEFRKNEKFTSFDRFFKHLEDLTISSLDKHRSIMVTFYMFEAAPFIPPKVAKDSEILRRIDRGLKSGVEMWQVNCKFDKDGMELVDYYEMFR